MFRSVATDRFRVLMAVTAVLLIAFLGCGDVGPTDEQQVNITIANLSDAALDPGSFTSFFVAGSVPDESLRHRYRELFYEIDPPVISGNSATAMVRMTNVAGEIIAEKEWTFSKVDTEWKIIAAPLP